MKDYRMNYFESFCYVLFNIILFVALFALLAGLGIVFGLSLHWITMNVSIWAALGVVLVATVAVVARFVHQNEQTRVYREW